MSEQQIEKLKSILIDQKNLASESIDRLYNKFLSGTIERKEYQEKLAIWEDRYFSSEQKLRAL